MAAISGLTLVKPRRRLGGHVSRPARIEVCPDTGELRLRQLDNGKGSPVKLHSLAGADVVAVDETPAAVPNSAREHLDGTMHSSDSEPDIVSIVLPGKRLFVKGTSVSAIKQLLAEQTPVDLLTKETLPKEPTFQKKVNRSSRAPKTKQAPQSMSEDVHCDKIEDKILEDALSGVS